MPDNMRILLGGSTSTRIVLDPAHAVLHCELGSDRLEVVAVPQSAARRLPLRAGDRAVAAAGGRVPTAMRLPETPYTRIFRQGANFFSELRPGALRENAAAAARPVRDAAARALARAREGAGRGARHRVRRLVWLAIIGVVSPLLGLLGTVLGVMNAFLGISRTGAANIASVAPGIAEALTTTAFGLVAAIPAAIAYNYFVTRLDRFSGELDGFASEFIGTLAREGRL
jgi:biopolymer transport protein TolQ